MIDCINGLEDLSKLWKQRIDESIDFVKELNEYSGFKMSIKSFKLEFRITDEENTQAEKGDPKSRTGNSQSEKSEFKKQNFKGFGNILENLSAVEKHLVFYIENLIILEKNLVQNHPELAPLFRKLRRRQSFIGLDLEEEQRQVIKKKINNEGLSFRSYLIPLTFLMIVYFGGILVTIPLINSVFTGEPVTAYIPLFSGDNSKIPFQVIEWGFLGGLVYTSINLLYRFLRQDLTPKVFIYGSFRIIYATVSSIIIYFIYIIPSQNNTAMVSLETPTYILLVCFAIGIAPIQFLIRAAESVYMRITQAVTRDQPGKDSISANIDGINLVTAERLNEEGVSCIEHLAFCDPRVISKMTRIPLLTIVDWKDEALLYLFTAGVKIPLKSNKDGKEATLYEFITSKLGIRGYLELSNVSEKTDDFNLEEVLKNSSLELSSEGLKSLLQRTTSYKDKYFDVMKEIRESKEEKTEKAAY